MGGMPVGEAGERSGEPVEFPALATETAERMASVLGAAALTGNAEARPLHVNTVVDPASGDLKIVLIAAPSHAARLLELLELQVGLPQ